jgi:glycosyltransferase involved in cell wall biosynthesis
MKIVLVSIAPPFRGGISTHTKGIYNELKKNHDVRIFSFYYQYPSFFFPGKSQKIKNDDKFKNTDYSISTINPFSWINTVRKILIVKPDLLIFTHWNPFVSFSLSFIARVLKSSIDSNRLVSICHNIKPHENNLVDNALIKFYLKPFKRFMFMSSFVQKELNLYKNKYKSIVRFLPIDINYISTKNKSSIRLDMGFDAKNKIVLFFGLIRPYKGLDNLLNAIESFIINNTNSILIVAGEAYENINKYKEIAKKYDSNNQIIWINKFIDDKKIEELMLASDLLVLPYNSASQSGVLSQAWQYNLPAIVTNVGGLSEYVDENKSGYIVEPNDTVGLSAKIGHFFNSNDSLEMPKYIKLNKHKYSWDNYIEGIMGLVNES